MQQKADGNLRKQWEMILLDQRTDIYKTRAGKPTPLGVGGCQSAKLVIPAAPPPGLNQQERMHWAARDRLRKEWEKFAWEAWLEAGRPKFQFPFIQFRLYYRTERKRDFDNAFAAIKPILDGLKGHAFVDDDVSHIRLELQVLDVDQQHPRVEIHITEQGWG